MSTNSTTTEGKTVLVTGANRGIGRALVDKVLTRGASRKRRIAALPPPAAADWEAFWDSTLDRLKAAAEADEIEDR